MVLVSACVLALVLPVADDKAAAVLKGKWQVVSATFNGDAVAAETVKKRQIVFGDGEFTAYDGGKKGRTVTFTLDPKADPKRIDLLAPGKDKALGIYELKGDELKLCYGEPGATRPAKFASEAGERVFLLVLKRVKE